MWQMPLERKHLQKAHEADAGCTGLSTALKLDVMSTVRPGLSLRDFAFTRPGFRFNQQPHDASAKKPDSRKVIR